MLKILTDGFHNDKLIHSLVYKKKNKKGGQNGKKVALKDATNVPTHTPLKTPLTAEMFLICWGCFSLTGFVVEDCHRFHLSKKFVN